jgi:hypothetical protein
MDTLDQAVITVQNWPTPTTAEAGKISNQPNYGQVGLSNHPAIRGELNREKLKKDRLNQEKQWPTPTALEAQDQGTNWECLARLDKGGRILRRIASLAHSGQAAPENHSTDGSRPGWLTPQVQDSKYSGANLTENGDRDLLVNQVNWPTPMQQDARIGPNNVGGNAHRVARGSVALADAVLFPKQVNWQTATVSTGAHRQKDVSMTDKLDQQVKSLATPQSRDAKGAEGRMIREGHCSDLPSQTEVAPTGQWNRSNGKLNSRWVSVLMNLPVFWTRP